VFDGWLTPRGPAPVHNVRAEKRSDNCWEFAYDSDAIRCRLIDENVVPQIPSHLRRATKFVKTLPAK